MGRLRRRRCVIIISCNSHRLARNFYLGYVFMKSIMSNASESFASPKSNTTKSNPLPYSKSSSSLDASSPSSRGHASPTHDVVTSSPKSRYRRKIPDFRKRGPNTRLTRTQNNLESNTEPPHYPPEYFKNLTDMGPLIWAPMVGPDGVAWVLATVAQMKQAVYDSMNTVYLD